MSKEIEILLPDIGDFEAVEVIEVPVNDGDKIQLEDTLITLESDKATIDIPSPHSGTIKNVSIKVGDKVSQGDLILTLEQEPAALPGAPLAGKWRQYLLRQPHHR